MSGLRRYTERQPDLVPRHAGVAGSGHQGSRRLSTRSNSTRWRASSSNTQSIGLVVGTAGRPLGRRFLGIVSILVDNSN